MNAADYDSRQRRIRARKDLVFMSIDHIDHAVSRRNLVRNGSLISGAIAASALVSASTAVTPAVASEDSVSADSSAASSDAEYDYSADVVVVGSGFGGMVAGVRALQNGVENVILVEISKWLGGGTSFSVGTVHVGAAGTTDEEYDTFERGQSTGELSHAAFDSVPDLLAWLQTLDLPIEVSGVGESSGSGLEAQTSSSGNAPRGHFVNEQGEGGVIAGHYFFTQFGNLFESLGGTLLTETRADKLIVDENNAIAGIVCYGSDDKPIRIKTTQVILACGGFQNDEELKCRYLGRDAWSAAVMGSPYNNGAGIKMATAIGASLQGEMGRFAGQFAPALPAKAWCEDVDAYEQGDYNQEVGGKWFMADMNLDTLPNSGIVVNNYGKRFGDEKSDGHNFEPLVAQQPHAVGIIITDDDGWNDWTGSLTYSVMQTIGEKLEHILSEEVGGAAYTGNTIEELADNLNASGLASHSVVKANLVNTVAEYNAAVDAGTTADLEVPRTTGNILPIVTPPFHAMPIRNSIFVTFGGLAVNEKAQVLGPSRKPIPGLYACSPTAGGFMHEMYVGSIAHAGVTGMWAGDAVAEALGVKQG
jgi:succinate dehydrogenase/fumarate reductase flavoprotein subunit